MEPNKFEKYIREQLLDRKIAPAPESWDKVVRKLEATERPKRNRYYWAGIAAGFIGLLMVLGMFFKEDSPTSAPEDKMVLSPAEQKEGQDPNAKKEGVLFDQNGLNEMVDPNETTPEFENKAKAVRSRPGPGPLHKPAQPISNLARMQSPILPADSMERMIALKVAEVVAQIEDPRSGTCNCDDRCRGRYFAPQCPKGTDDRSNVPKVKQDRSQHIAGQR